MDNIGKIVAVANQKGGVGKTTIAVHLAKGATEKGKRVIVVDADPQGNLTSWLLDGDTSDAGLFRLLVVDEPLRKVIRPLRKWGFGLLPGNYRTGEAMVFLAATGKVEKIRVLEQLRDVADYVLIDMPPSQNAGFEELLGVADWMVIPTMLERLSLEGVVLMSQTCGSLKERGSTVRLMGIVPNMVRLRTKEQQMQLDDLTRVFGQAVWNPIPLSVRVQEAASFGSTLFEMCPGESAAEAMQGIVERFLNVEA